MKYNEKVERFSPKLGRKNLVNGLSCPPFVYMEDSDNGMWVHYAKYCKNIAKQKYKRCMAMAVICFNRAERANCWKEEVKSRKRFEKWLELAERFKEAK